VPWIELEGAANVRDLGGLVTQDGGETVAGRLLRGDNLQELSPSDVATLVGDIGLTTVVDLRSTAELVSEGPAPLDAVTAVQHAHHPILSERDRYRYPADPLCGHYLGYLEDRPDQVVAALRSVAGAGGAALVHCAAGKDRTGVVAALALTAVGVRAQDVVADYAATGERIAGIVERLRRSPIYAADINSRPAEQHRPRPQTMTAFLDQVRARYGGATRWLAGHGFGRADLDRLHAKLRRP